MRNDTNRERAREAVLTAFHGIFGIAAPHGLDTAPCHVPDWTSLAQVRLVHAVEQELDCAFDARLLSLGSTLAELADAVPR